MKPKEYESYSLISLWTRKMVAVTALGSTNARRLYQNKSLFDISKHWFFIDFRMAETVFFMHEK